MSSACGIEKRTQGDLALRKALLSSHLHMAAKAEGQQW